MERRTEARFRCTDQDDTFTVRCHNPDVSLWIRCCIPDDCRRYCDTSRSWIIDRRYYHDVVAVAIDNVDIVYCNSNGKTDVHRVYIDRIRNQIYQQLSQSSQSNPPRNDNDPNDDTDRQLQLFDATRRSRKEDAHEV